MLNNCSRNRTGCPFCYAELFIAMLYMDASFEMATDLRYADIIVGFFTFCFQILARCIFLH